MRRELVSKKKKESSKPRLARKNVLFSLFVLLFFTVHPEYGVWLWLQVWVDPDWSDCVVELGQ